MCPITHTNLLILLGITVISFIFGFIWYGPAFGKTWAQLVGKKCDELQGKPPISSMLITFLGTFATVVVMSYLLNEAKSYCHYDIVFFVWLGFQVPILLGAVTWEGRSWKLFVLNGLYYFLNLQLIALILTYWK